MANRQFDRGIELTRKNLNRNIARLAIPAAGENILHMTIFIADIVMVGRLGTEAIAAVGLAGALNFIITIIFSSLNAGTLSLVARHSGAGERKDAERVAAQSMLLAILIGITISPVLVLYAQKVLLLMSAEPPIAALGTAYLKIVMTMLICRLIILAGSAAFRGAGDTRTPMLITLIMNCVNVLSNWLLIFGIWIFPRMGVIGAAWGTAIAYGVGAVITFIIFFSGKGVLAVSVGNLFRFDLTTIWRILRISLPATFDSFFTQIGYLIFIKIVTMLGTASLAAHQVAVRIEAISFMPGFALAVSTATLVGQSLGAKDVALASLSMKRNCQYALMLMGFFAFIFLAFPVPMARIFSPEPEVLRLSVLCVMISAIEQPALAIYMVYSGGLRGAGDTLSPMLVTIVGTLCFHVSLAYLFGIVLGWGLGGVWFGAALDWICRSIAVYILFRRGRWKRVKV
ncbi:MAG TPA: MATE family efflux transporter [Candidatus Brocadiales bacterium]|nr:MATE family efflux transporter [Candidatus Brocadiales bacterium]